LSFLGTLVSIAWGVSFTQVLFIFLGSGLSDSGARIGSEVLIKSLLLLSIMFCFALFGGTVSQLDTVAKEFWQAMRRSPSHRPVPGWRFASHLSRFVGILLLSVTVLVVGLVVFDSDAVNGYHVAMVAMLFTLVTYEVGLRSKA